MAFGDTGEPELRVCCGPRCGAEPGHRLIYGTVEATARRHGLAVRPVMCQGYCHGGVTVLLPDGEARKVRDTAEARAISKDLG